MAEDAPEQKARTSGVPRAWCVALARESDRERGLLLRRRTHGHVAAVRGDDALHDIEPEPLVRVTCEGFPNWPWPWYRRNEAPTKTNGIVNFTGSVPFGQCRPSRAGTEPRLCAPAGPWSVEGHRTCSPRPQRAHSDVWRYALTARIDSPGRHALRPAHCPRDRKRGRRWGFLVRIGAGRAAGRSGLISEGAARICIPSRNRTRRMQPLAFPIR